MHELEKLKQANDICEFDLKRVNWSKCSVLFTNANKNEIPHIYAIKVRAWGRARVTGRTKHGRRHRVRVCTALETIQGCHCQCLSTLFLAYVRFELLLTATMIFLVFQFICWQMFKTNDHPYKYIDLIKIQIFNTAVQFLRKYIIEVKFKIIILKYYS